MVSRKLHSFTSIALVGSLIALASIGCQSATDSASDDTTTPDATTAPSEETAATPEATSEAVEESATDTTDTTVAEAVPAEEQSCSAAAFVVDDDPAGLNVRSGPGSDFPVIDNLPTDGPVEVTIAAAANGWMKLSVAWSMQQQELEEEGWVYAPLLGVTTRSEDSSSPDVPVALLADPDAAATVASELPQFEEVTLLSCSGDWLQVQGTGSEGWLAAGNQCSSPVTTCP
ncbi:MAG: SH3 domain-containing protein [Cyanobacteria bacterium P01_H01_bin.58]